MNDTGKKPLNDAELNNVNGGMKIVVTSLPKLFSPILRLIFKVKSK